VDGVSGDYAAVTGPCNLTFPADHAPHPGFRTEWWYYTGNLTDGSGKRFGYQFTIFRRQLRPNSARESWPQPASAWRTDQIYLAHAAITDLDAGRHRHWERLSRGAVGLAGAERTGDGVRIFVDEWSAAIRQNGHTLRMAAPDGAFDLDLSPLKPLVRHGENGYSRKGSTPERASCYYSFTRLRTSGRLRLAGAEIPVTGLSWMDHEFSTASLEPGIAGWDWFSLQLDNGTELMVYLLRRDTGGYHPASSGTIVEPDGTARHLPRSRIRAEVLRTWQSPETRARYPLSWRLSISSIALELEITTPVDRQEMVTAESTRVTYWEGAVTARGTSGRTPVSGSGYMELTGYVEALEALQ
jgi:predicted secreted hydrolase